jgi:hypothetical protein
LAECRKKEEYVVVMGRITFAKALKSAKPPPKDSFPNTAANGSVRHIQAEGGVSKG